MKIVAEEYSNLVAECDNEIKAELFENKVDAWLRNFQKDHNDFVVVNADILDELARALCDDIPLGYEASHRLASWLFAYLNKRANRFKKKK